MRNRHMYANIILVTIFMCRQYAWVLDNNKDWKAEVYYYFESLILEDQRTFHLNYRLTELAERLVSVMIFNNFAI